MASASASTSSSPSDPDVIYLLGTGIYYVQYRGDADESSRIRHWPVGPWGLWPIRETIRVPDEWPEGEPVQLVMCMRGEPVEEPLTGSESDGEGDGPVVDTYDFRGRTFYISYYSDVALLVQANPAAVRYWDQGMQAYHGAWPFSAENAGGLDQACTRPAFPRAQEYLRTIRARVWIRRH